MKTCAKCKVEKPIERFGIRKNPYKTARVYYNSICKSCLSKAMTEWRKKNQERYNTYQKEYKNKIKQ